MNVRTGLGSVAVAWLLALGGAAVPAHAASAHPTAAVTPTVQFCAGGDVVFRQGIKRARAIRSAEIEAAESILRKSRETAADRSRFAAAKRDAQQAFRAARERAADARRAAC